MISRFWLMGMVASLVALAGCGGDEGGGDSGAGKGEACEAGTDCGAGLFCSMKGLDAKEGTCETLPDGCGETPKCSNECGDLLDMACGGGSSVCVSVASKITYACGGSSSGSATEGQACGAGSDCVSGLVCVVKTGAGTCTAPPAECGGAPACSGTCGDAITALCGGGSSSCSGSGNPTLTCG